MRLVSSAPLILTKIIATLGPATRDAATVARLIEEGARVFRLNFSHGDEASHYALLTAVRDAAQRLGVAVGVLGDLCGPKIRLGKVVEGSVELHTGQSVTLGGGDAVAGARDAFTLNDASVLADVRVGQRVLIDDGNVRMLATDRRDEALVCTVTEGGTVSTGKGVNLPDTTLRLPSLTNHDHRCIDWALRNGLDFLALSFVRQASDVTLLREVLQSRTPGGGATVPIIAKIEKPQALADLEAITQTADALMVARGDLGVEMDLAQVPSIQKKTIKLAHDFGKPVIVATQMLQSMIDSPSPTRAEVSDVANAIYDGADAVMLSGETAVGRYPIQTVMAMARVAGTTEQHLREDTVTYPRRPPRRPQESRYRTAALAHGVGVMVRDMAAQLVVCWSQQGGAARYLSQNRMCVPIVAASSDPAALRRMTLYYGVQPAAMAQPRDAAEFLAMVDHLILDRDWAGSGQPVVIVKGEPIGAQGVTNQVQLHYVGDAGGRG